MSSCCEYALVLLLAVQTRVAAVVAPVTPILSEFRPALASTFEVGWCDCYDSEPIANASAAWTKVACTKNGFFLVSVGLSRLSGHDGYELVPNNFGGENPITCCRPCFNTTVASSTSSEVGAEDRSFFHMDEPERSRVQHRVAGQTVTTKVDWFDCHGENISATAAIVECSEEGYLVAGLGIGAINGHEGFEIAPNGNGLVDPITCCRPGYSAVQEPWLGTSPRNAALQVGTKTTRRTKANATAVPTPPSSSATDTDTAIAGSTVFLDWCECYDTARIENPDPSAQATSVGCDSAGFVVAGLGVSGISGHEGFEIVPNNYYNVWNPLLCCRPCLNSTAV